MRRFFRVPLLAALLLVPLSLTGCGGDSVTGPTDTGPTGPAAPVFSITSLGVTLTGGGAGLQWRATSNTRVRLVQIVVSTPNAQSVSYSPQGLIVQAGERFDLQQANTGFVRWSGAWTFRFVGNHEPGGGSFEVTQSVNVGA